MQQLDLQGKTKTEQAIEFLRKHEPENQSWFVGISGGKDSTVLYDLVKKSDVNAEFYYSATGIDPPEIVSFIKRNMGDVVFKKPKNSFYFDIVKKGYPTPLARWCCDTLKKNPTKDIPLKHRLMGIRAEESPRRRKFGSISQMGKWTIYKPIFGWLEWEVWEYIERHNLPYCKLYDEGHDRLGCVVCPFLQGQMAKIERNKKRWPGIYRAFEMSMYLLWERKLHHRDSVKGRAKLFDEFLDNWYRGK